MKFEKMSFAEALEYFKDKTGLSADDYYALAKEMRTLGFTISYAKNIEAVNAVKALLEKAIEEGMTFLDFRDSILEKIGAKEFSQFYSFHILTVFTTNISVSYSVGRYRQLQAVKKIRPYWQYHHSGSANPREAHLALDGKIFAADDPIWDIIFPPNGFNCGCTVTSISKEEMDDENLWNVFEEGKDETNRKKYLDDLENSISGEKERGFLTNPALGERYKPDMSKFSDAEKEGYKKMLAGRMKETEKIIKGMLN